MSFDDGSVLWQSVRVHRSTCSSKTDDSGELSCIVLILLLKIFLFSSLVSGTVCWEWDIHRLWHSCHGEEKQQHAESHLFTPWSWRKGARHKTIHFLLSSPSRSSSFSSFASSPPLSIARCTSLQCSACIWRRAIQRGKVNQLLLALSLIASLKVHAQCTCKFDSFHYIIFFSFLLSIRTRNHTAKHLRSCFSRCSLRSVERRMWAGSHLPRSGNSDIL